MKLSFPHPGRRFAPPEYKLQRESIAQRIKVDARFREHEKMERRPPPG